jgi:hypothetical protein
MSIVNGLRRDNLVRPIDFCPLLFGDWLLEIGDWLSEIGDWLSEIGDWLLEIGDC